MENKEFVKLITNYQTSGCLKARDEAILAVMPMLNGLVSKFNASNGREDLLHEGIIGVMHACNLFDATKGPFLTYAKTCARFSIIGYIRNDNVIPRGSRSMHSHNLSCSSVPESHSEIVELAQSRGLPYITVQNYAVSGEGSMSLVDKRSGLDSTLLGAERLEEREQLAEKLERLKSRQYDILDRHFVNEDTYKEIGQAYGVSTSRIGQIIQDTIQKLRL